MNNKNILVVIGLVVLGIGLIVSSKFMSPDYKQTKVWKQSGVECIPGHQNIAQHIHADLHIIIDGENQNLPQNIGLNRQCMSELHTHDSSGRIHIETIVPNKDKTLGDFFAIWGQSIFKEGYNVIMTVNGTPSEDFVDHVFRDGQVIILEYATASE